LNQTEGQLVTIECDTDADNASITNALTGSSVGSVMLLDNELILTLDDASEDALPQVLPESIRCYARFSDSVALQVFGVRLGDMPIGMIMDIIGTPPLVYHRRLVRLLGHHAQQSIHIFWRGFSSVCVFNQ